MNYQLEQKDSKIIDFIGFYEGNHLFLSGFLGIFRLIFAVFAGLSEPILLYELFIDESDPSDCFECEGKVLKSFFESPKLFNQKQNLELLHKGRDIERALNY